MTGTETGLLARDLRRSIGDFVRAVRQDTGTARSAQSETLDFLCRLGPMNVAAVAGARGVTHQVSAQNAASTIQGARTAMKPPERNPAPVRPGIAGGSKARAPPWTRQGEPPWTGFPWVARSRGAAAGGVRGRSPWPCFPVEPRISLCASGEPRMTPENPRRLCAEIDAALRGTAELTAVSYTHLTLPTKA